VTSNPPPATRTSWTGWTPAHGSPLVPLGSEADPRVAFVLNLGRALHSSGYSADRLEEALSLASERLGLLGQFFSTPTSIMASFGPQDDQRTFMIRVDPASANLGKLARVDGVTRDVLSGRLTPSEGTAAIAAIESAAPEYGALLTTLAFGCVSASAARFLGGGATEIGAALGVGLLTGLLAILAGRHAGLERVFEAVAAFVASAVMSIAAALGLPVSVLIATLAGVIVLIPGLTLTTAITELSSRHLASGTARLAGAMVLLLGIAFGIALGAKVVALAPGDVPLLDPTPLPEWTILVPLLVAPLSFVVLLGAERRDAPWILVAGALAFLGAWFGGRYLGPELGAFVGALFTGMGSRWYSRITNRPSSITLVPGLLLLVPGSIGLRSLTSLVDRDVLIGIEGIFQMGLIAVSLASGILVSRLVSPRRALMD
jgi:uncharacterized membrane protein YjjP (DUF1212 family)